MYVFLKLDIQSKDRLIQKFNPLSKFHIALSFYTKLSKTILVD